MSIQSFLPAFLTVLVAALGFVGFHFIRSSQPEHRLAQQLGQVAWGLLAVIVLIITLPLGPTLRGQVLSLLGIVLSGAVALSSTTLLGNMLAGLMLRANRAFRLGDFIEVAGLQGRVSARGLIQVEIQTSDRGLQTMPNLKLINEPVKVLPKEGALIYAEVSLGYDLPRALVEESLLAAAQEAELASPFVHVMALGDFSVVYRISGQLADIGTLLTSKARLLAAVMDQLHAADVEIVSPGFMNTRALQQQRFLPAKKSPPPTPSAATETVDEQIFDKAEEAEKIEALEEALEAAPETAPEAEKP